MEDDTKSIELDSTNGYAYCNRALTKLALNQKESACQDFKKAADLGNEQAKEEMKKYCQ